MIDPNEREPIDIVPYDGYRYTPWWGEGSEPYMLPCHLVPERPNKLPVAIHLRADRSLDPKTAAALGELIDLARAFIEQSEVGADDDGDDEPLTDAERAELRELEAEYWYDDDEDLPDDDLYSAVCEHCGGTGREADVSCPWCQGLGTLT